MLQVKGHDELSQQCSTEDLTPLKVQRTSRDYKVHINLFNIDREEFKTTKPEEEECGLFLLSSSKKTLPTMTSQSGAHSLISHLFTTSTPQPTRLRQGIKKSRQFKPRPPLINQSIALVKEETFPTCLTKGYDIKTE